MSKKMKDKVKKLKVDWTSVLYSLHEECMYEQYYLLLQKHKGMSANRRAYYSLKKYYSTTAMRKAAFLFRTEGVLSAVNYLNWYEMHTTHVCS